MKMIFKHNQGILIWALSLALFSCKDDHRNSEHADPGHHGEEEAHAEGTEAMLTQQQFDALGMEVEKLQEKNLASFVQANGKLEVPPQNEAAVTAVMGANISRIMVIEGEQVRNGETLAYLTHPDLVKVQTEFLNAYNELVLQEKEYKRQKTLYDAGVGSGETFERAEAALQIARGRVEGLRSQLNLLHLNPDRILQGEFYRQIPVVSPISGAVQEVHVKTGQYVQAQTTLFEIVNTHHIHADLLVFEGDVSQVQEGQEVHLTVEALPGKDLKAEVLSVGKMFREDPKAVKVHAELKQKPEDLIPGMYVRGRILTDSTRTSALPESAIAREGDQYFVFSAEREGESWSFKPIEIRPGASSDGWTAVKFLSSPEPDTEFAHNNAYYLMAQMNKGEGGHEH